MRLPVILSNLAAVAALASATAADPEELVYVPNSTRKVCQLTGDLDRATGKPTLSLTGQRFGVAATDLGSSFDHQGRLYFLFGDTWGRPGGRDALAWTESTDPGQIVLDFHRGEDGKWLPPTVPGITHGAFEVPSGGVSISDTMYVVFTTDHSLKKVMGRSVVAGSSDDGRTFKMRYELSRDRFINVSFWSAGGWLYVFGSGAYRKSSVHLARVKPADIGDRSRLRYFRGTGPDGEPRWSSSEADSVPLFRHDVVGEFSVAYLEPVKRYVMLYNSPAPRGITMRSSGTPWGPWSRGTVLFDPFRDSGYGHFMHISANFKEKSDALSDPMRDDEWGGEYGPYIMARFTSGSDGRCRIYYTMSTWNPYQVVVMQSDLVLFPPSCAEIPVKETSMIVRSGFIYERASFPSAHASTIVETGDTIAAAWFGGTSEGDPDVGIWLSRYDGRGWSDPAEVADGAQPDGKQHPCWNPVLFQPARGPLLLFYKVGPNPREWWGLVRTSKDAGRSWSEPVRLPHGMLGPIRAKPVELADGTLIAGSSSEHAGWVVHIERYHGSLTDDVNPETGGWNTESLSSAGAWEKTGPLNDPEAFGAIQPTLLVHSPEKLQMLCRSRQGVITEAWSEDAGRTWSPMAATSLPNPNAGIDVTRLMDGRFLLVYNPTSQGRDRLALAISDDGRMWREVAVLEDSPGEFSYPAQMQSRDGLVHITYTWKRERIKHVVVDPSRIE